MKPLVAGLLLATVLAACGSDGSGGSVPDTTGSEITVASRAFDEGETIPTKYTCEGADVSPPLEWSEDDPGGTYVVVMFDPDAPGEGFVHWVLADVHTPLEEGATGGTAVTNDFGDADYGGPCPPPGEKPHRYEFSVYKLDESFELPEGDLEAAGVLEAIDGHIALSGTLTGLFGR